MYVIVVIKHITKLLSVLFFFLKYKKGYFS